LTSPGASLRFIKKRFRLREKGFRQQPVKAKWSVAYADHFGPCRQGDISLDDRCLLFFVRNPERGAVKTRLAGALGEQGTRDLYRNFVLDMLSQLQGGIYRLIICYHPEDALEDVKRIVGEGYHFQPQRGDDLGMKMEQCLANAFSSGFKRAIVIGSDVPDLPAEITEESFAALEVYDSVIGPALDGGYYLVGFQRASFLPEAFRGIEWGTDIVLRQTLDIFRDNKRTVHLLPPLRDIDTPEDLKAFFQKNRGTPNCPHTMTFLNQSKLLSIKDEG